MKRWRRNGNGKTLTPNERGGDPNIPPGFFRTMLKWMSRDVPDKYKK